MCSQINYCTSICTSKHTQNLLFAENLQDTFLMKTFCITVSTYLAKFLPTVSEIYKIKRLFYLLFKFSIFFDMYLKTYMDIFSHIFKMVTPRALRQVLLFIALNYLTSAAFIANLCSHLIPVHYKTSTTCTSKRTF